MHHDDLTAGFATLIRRIRSSSGKQSGPEDVELGLVGAHRAWYCTHPVAERSSRAPCQYVQTRPTVLPVLEPRPAFGVLQHLYPAPQICPTSFRTTESSDASSIANIPSVTYGRPFILLEESLEVANIR